MGVKRKASGNDRAQADKYQRRAAKSPGWFRRSEGPLAQAPACSQQALEYPLGDPIKSGEPDCCTITEA
uniref:Uncharacterized protein n=1 Tax=Romanomermis culicivorax TaxID=13658 RepID=A0A915K990_ROMCU